MSKRYKPMLVAAAVVGAFVLGGVRGHGDDADKGYDSSYFKEVYHSRIEGDTQNFAVGRIEEAAADERKLRALSVMGMTDTAQGSPRTIDMQIVVARQNQILIAQNADILKELKKISGRAAAP